MLGHSLIIGLTFLEPAALLLGAAAVVPILIHLWNRRVVADLDWAAMQFVIMAAQIEKRRILLREYVLLALRVLAIILLAVAAARPVIESPLMATSFRTRTGWVFILDDSLSMQQVAGEGSCFERAIRLMRTIVETAAPGDMFCLLGAAQVPRWHVRMATGDRQGLFRTINELECRHTENNWRAAFQEVLQRVRQLREEQPQLGRFVVVILTDGQQNYWSDEFTIYKNEFEDVLRSLSELAEVQSYEIPGAAANCAVTRLEAWPSSVTVAEDVLFSGAVSCYGRVDRRPDRVAWFINGQKIGESMITWDSDRQGGFSWFHRLNKPGEYVVDAVIDDDPLLEDNRRGVVVSVYDSVKILCVDGRFSPVIFEGASDYLRTALTALNSADNLELMRVQTIPEGRLAETDLEQYRVVILCDVAQISRGETLLLRDFVKRGGGLAIFLGPRVRADVYNAMSGELGQDSFMPGSLEKKIEQPGIAISHFNSQHPISRVFESRGSAGLVGVPVRAYYRFRSAPNIPVDTAGFYTTNDPFLVTWNIGLGRVALVTTSGDATWTSLPLWPGWVPLVMEIKNFLLAGATDDRTLTCGEPLADWRGNGVLGDKAVVAITRPSGASEHEALRWDKGLWHWTYQNTDISGVYRAAMTGEQGRLTSAVFRVNTPEKESDIRSDAWKELISTLSTQIHVRDEAAVAVESDAGGISQNGRTLPQMLLTGLLVLLLLELFISNISLKTRLF